MAKKSQVLRDQKRRKPEPRAHDYLSLSSLAPPLVTVTKTFLRGL